MDYKLFIPGPVAISSGTYQALTQPVMGHRSADFVALYQRVQPKLQALFETQDPVFLSTSSAWGIMEGAIRNVTQKGLLVCASGAFSDKWLDVARRCGLPAEALQYAWGTPVDPEDVRARLATGQFDAITVTHNETSTGTMNPLGEIAAVLREFPDVISIVDAVSSLSAVPLPKDDWGIDVLITGSQKALALPPGLALCSVSDRAMARAETVEGRGYYFDFLEFRKNHEKGMTPSTPIIPLIYGLEYQLGTIEAEGIEARRARHARLNAKVHAWVDKHQLETLPPRAFASKTLTCVRNLHDWDLKAFNAKLRDRARCVIDGGYGKIKGKTFRISNMGDETDATIDALIANLDAVV